MATGLFSIEYRKETVAALCLDCGAVAELPNNKEGQVRLQAWMDEHQQPLPFATPAERREYQEEL